MSQGALGRGEEESAGEGENVDVAMLEGMGS